MKKLQAGPHRGVKHLTCFFSSKSDLEIMFRLLSMCIVDSIASFKEY